MPRRRRDRHARGLRGPVLPLTSPLARSARLPGQMSRAETFLRAVEDAIARVQRTCPEALLGIDIGVEDVPRARPGEDRVPLSAAIDATSTTPARVVIYRRPLEHRSATRRGLAILTHRTLVEQLSAMTGRSVHEIDPQIDEDDD